MYSGMPTMEMNSHLKVLNGVEFSRGRRASRHTYTILNTRYNINNNALGKDSTTIGINLWFGPHNSEH